MNRRALVHLICWLGLLTPSVTASAQTTPEPPPKPAAGAPATPPAAPSTQADEVEETPGSLFTPTWREFSLGGRIGSVDGDPARWQRYQDIRDGLLFTNARYAREGTDGNWLFRGSVDNLGWRDQRFFGEYEQTGRFKVKGLWDQIPQFYSVDTATPYTTAGDDALVLDDATQRAIQNAQANLNAYVPQAPKFELHERRDVGSVSFLATPTREIDLKASFTTNRHVGELPWGASFGFSNDVEVALPYDSRTNDLSLGAEWSNNRHMFRVGYSGSWFDNLDETLVWDSPLRLDDSPTIPGRGRMALWPSNSAQTFSAGGYTKLAKRTQLTGFMSFGFHSNDEPLQPFTINPTLPQLALPRGTTEADANVFSTNLNLVSRPSNEWRFSTRIRHYGYTNNTPQAIIPEFINYDTSIKASSTGGPELYAHSRTNFDADATWSGISPFALTAGYAHNSTGHDFRIFESTGEDVFRLVADAVGSQWMTFRAQWEVSDRAGSDLDEELLTEIGEQPALRHYDVANRGRNRFTGQVDVTPNEQWTLSASAGFGKDDYDDSYFGLQESTVTLFSFGADYMHPTGFGGGATYNYEEYGGFQTSRSASPGQENDPLRDWTTDSAERVHYFSLYALTPRIGRNTEARFSYDYSHAEGSYLYGVVPGGPLPPPSQLPDVFNKLQQFHVDVRHRINNRLQGTFSYLYEPFRVYDFAFDPSVVNSIVQPSSLVLGYVYRPYTVHSVVFGIKYLW